MIRVVPLRNRVTPFGDLVAVPERGLVYGNRGCLHDAGGRIVRRSATKRWIACRLAYRGWYQGGTPRPGRFTGLFFLDDATALAAGHRPCALCRRADYTRVLTVLGIRGADTLDAQLHAERTGERARATAASLPDGAFVLREGAPHVVVGGGLRAWTPGGYGAATAAAGELEVLTPASLVRVLAEGWEPLVPFLHPSARRETIAR